VTTGAVKDLATEPETKVTVGDDAVPVILTVELGSRVTVLPLLRATTAVDEEVVMVSPDTSGNEPTPGVEMVWPSRLKAAPLVTVAIEPANAETLRADKSTAER